MVSGGPQPPPRSRLALTLLPGSQAALELCGEEAGLLGGGAGIPGSSLRLGRRPSPPAPLTGHGVYPRGHTWPLPWPGSEPRGRKGNQAAPGAPGVPLLPSHPHAPTGRMEKVRLGRRRRPQGPGGASPPPPNPAERGRGAAEEAPDGPDSRLPQRRPGTRPPLSTTLAAENIYIQIRPNAPYFCLKPAWESVPATWELGGGDAWVGRVLPSRGADESYQRPG